MKKTAKELFKELGWGCVNDANTNRIIYTNEDDSKWHWEEELIFDFSLKETRIHSLGYIKLTPQLLKAINKQVEELGWRNN